MKKDSLSNWYCADDEDLNLYLAEKTLEDLINSFISWIDMLWHEYVIEDDEKLGKLAINIKYNLNKLNVKKLFQRVY